MSHDPLAYIRTFDGCTSFTIANSLGTCWKTRLLSSLLVLGFDPEESRIFVVSLPDDYCKAQREAGIGGFLFSV